jgi:hypothetical protein
VTEEEAANRLCALLNEIEAAGHSIEVDYDRNMNVGQDCRMMWDYRINSWAVTDQ